MMQLLELLLTGLTALVLVPTLVLFLQVLAALLPPRRAELSAGARPRIAVLIPAHDEAVVIDETLRSIIPQLEKGDRLLVVADNCSDATAAIAAEAGAEVAERTNASERGKGFALDYGVRHLRIDPPEVVIIVDADCHVAPGSIDRLARVSHATARPTQSLDLMMSPVGAALKTRIAEFAWVVKNHVRPLGYHRFGLPCQLMGTGMAIPWLIIEKAQLANGHIVEDMKLGIDLALAGMATQFCPEALVTSEFPSSKAAQQTQRVRWEHGHLEMILCYVPQLMRQALWNRDSGLLALGLDLCVPPLALLGLLVAAVLVVDAILAFLANTWLPLSLAALAVAFVVMTLSLAWWFFGRTILSPGNLAYAPIYGLMKIPLYLKFIFSRQVEWVRSGRESKSSGELEILRPSDFVSKSISSAVEPATFAVAGRRYVLISPCRNEAAYMRRTLDTVIAQSERPAKWVIVDDGSTDDTSCILKEYQQHHDWIEVVTRADRGRRAVGPGVIEAFYAGYNTINPDDYDYLCKLDLDLVLPHRYFEALMERMEGNPRIATCSGKSYIERDGALVSERHGDETSLGMTKFYRVSRFQAIGGFVREVMWDGIDCHRCRMQGWIACSWDDLELRFVHLRPMGSSEKSIFVGRMRHGYGQYFMGTGILWILACVFYRFPERPFLLGGLAIFWGWLRSALKCMPRYEDPNFRRFLRRYHRRALLIGKRRAVEEIYREAGLAG
jgi:cellulose synthase/poly-beta-1,6-N-acetylglucosamine synthase-like glycosyltransferase